MRPSSDHDTRPLAQSSGRPTTDVTVSRKALALLYECAVSYDARIPEGNGCGWVDEIRAAIDAPPRESTVAKRKTRYPPNIPLARALAEVRAIGVPMYVIAARSACSPALLSMIVRGAAPATTERARSIANALGRPVRELFPNVSEEVR